MGSQEVLRLMWEVKVRGCPEVRLCPSSTSAWGPALRAGDCTANLVVNLDTRSNGKKTVCWQRRGSLIPSAEVDSKCLLRSAGVGGFQLLERGTEILKLNFLIHFLSF